MLGVGDSRPEPSFRGCRSPSQAGECESPPSGLQANPLGCRGPGEPSPQGHGRPLPRTCRITQCPFSAATSRAFSATTSCPCPRDTLWSFPLSMVNPSFFPEGKKNRKSTGTAE